MFASILTEFHKKEKKNVSGFREFPLLIQISRKHIICVYATGRETRFAQVVDESRSRSCMRRSKLLCGTRRSSITVRLRSQTIGGVIAPPQCKVIHLKFLRQHQSYRSIEISPSFKDSVSASLERRVP